MSDDPSNEPNPPELPKQPEQSQRPETDSAQSNNQNQQQQNQFQQQQQQFLAMPGMPRLSQSQGILPGLNFFSTYQPTPNVFDEVLDGNHRLRPQWEQLAAELVTAGDEGIEHRDKQIRRTVYQNGIAFSAYGDPSVREKHLQLDPIPQLITNAEWVQVEEALIQRANLLNLMLADLYGSRTLLKQGVLPTEVLFGHPHYQLPYHDLPHPGGQHLHFYAAEIIRSPQGDWWVKSDRTDSPGGSGFALENRIAISRAFPNAFRRCNVQRHANYFIALRENLIGLAKTNKDNPHIAILSAGAGSERYFEDSFLARYLGFTLVETNDLVVRSRKVMLKTLAGLSQIDVIFRRHQSNSIDPLELGGGAPGVPGILQVIRDENVVVANAPGSGLVESPIFMAFLPRICQALMDSELRLPGVATWWGGEARSLELMLDRIDEIQLLPAYRVRSVIGQEQAKASRKPKHLRPETMTRDERINLVRTNPKVWVGQEKVARSSSAVWNDGKLSPGYVSLRTFLAASEGSWHSLPGGLVRVSGSPYESSRNPFEGGTKDAWVLAEKPVEPTSLLKKHGDQLQPIRSRGFLPSRIADNLCWLGRYLERADASARLLRAVAARMTGESDPSEAVELPVLVRALALSGQIDAGYAIKEFPGKLPPLESCLAANALNHGDTDSLRFQVDRIVALAGTVRDRLSRDAWRIVQEMSSSFSSSDPQNCDLVDLLDSIDTLVVGLAAFSGFVSECMTRTHGFHFLNIGRRLEHTLQTTSLLKNCFASTSEVTGELIESVLEVCESSLTYRSRYYASLQLPAVLDLLLADELNPRSLAYQLRKLNANLELLPDNSGVELSPDRRLTQEAQAAIQSADNFEICKVDGTGCRPQLRDLLEKIESLLPDVSTSLSNRFFVHCGPVHQMIVNVEEDE